MSAKGESDDLRLLLLNRANTKGITRPGQREQHLQALQEQLRVVQKPPQGRQNRRVILVLHKRHQVVFTYWRRGKLASAGRPVSLRAQLKSLIVERVVAGQKPRALNADTPF